MASYIVLTPSAIYFLVSAILSLCGIVSSYFICLPPGNNLHAFNQDLYQDIFPSIFGENADKNFVQFFNLLKNNGFPIDKIKEYYYFQIGRWDIKLLNKKIIKFPSKKIVPAIERSVKLLNREDFKKYNLIDLRMSNEVVVE